MSVTPAGWYSPTEPPRLSKPPLVQHQLRQRRRYVVLALRGRVLALWGKP